MIPLYLWQTCLGNWCFTVKNDKWQFLTLKQTLWFDMTKLDCQCLCWIKLSEWTSACCQQRPALLIAINVKSTAQLSDISDLCPFFIIHCYIWKGSENESESTWISIEFLCTLTVDDPSKYDIDLVYLCRCLWVQWRMWRKLWSGWATHTCMSGWDVTHLSMAFPARLFWYVSCPLIMIMC